MTTMTKTEIELLIFRTSDRSHTTMTIEAIPHPCPDCTASWQKHLAAHPNFVGVVRFLCFHNNVALSVEMDKGRIRDWRTYPASQESFNAGLAATVGIECAKHAMAEEYAREDKLAKLETDRDSLKLVH